MGCSGRFGEEVNEVVGPDRVNNCGVMPAVTVGRACYNCDGRCVRLSRHLAIGRFGQPHFDHQSANGEAIAIFQRLAVYDPLAINECPGCAAAILNECRPTVNRDNGMPVANKLVLQVNITTLGLANQDPRS